MADVEDDNLLLRVVYGVYDPIVPHADPVEMLLPPLNLRTTAGASRREPLYSGECAASKPDGFSNSCRSDSRRSHLLCSNSGAAVHRNYIVRQCHDISLDACLDADRASRHYRLYRFLDSLNSMAGSSRRSATTARS